MELSSFLSSFDMGIRHGNELSSIWKFVQSSLCSPRFSTLLTTNTLDACVGHRSYSRVLTVDIQSGLRLHLGGVVLADRLLAGRLEGPRG
jgi:hypothetical protein